MDSGSENKRIIAAAQAAMAKGGLLPKQRLALERIIDEGDECTPQACRLLGQLCVVREDWGECADFNEREYRWLKQNGQLADALGAMSRLLLALTLANKTARLAELVEEGRALVQCGTPDAQLRFWRNASALAVADGNFEEAARCLELAVVPARLVDEEALRETLMESVVVLGGTGQTENALRAASEIPAEGPDRGLAFMGVAVKLSERDAPERALAWWDRAIAEGLSSAFKRFALIEKSRSQAQIGRMRDAWSTLNEAWALPDTPPQYSGSDAVQEAQANETFRQAATWLGVQLGLGLGEEISPAGMGMLHGEPPGPHGSDPAWGYVVRAWYWLAIGSPESALADCEKALPIAADDSTRFRARCVLAMAHGQLGHSENALENLSLAEHEVALGRRDQAALALQVLQQAIAFGNGPVASEAAERLANALDSLDSDSWDGAIFALSARLELARYKLVAAQESAQGVSELQNIRERARAQGAAGVLAGASELLAQVSGDAAALEEAAALLERTGSLVRAASLWVRRAALAEADDPGEATVLYQRAFDLLSRLLPLLPFDGARISVRAQFASLALLLAKRMATTDLDGAFRVLTTGRAEALLHLIHAAATSNDAMRVRVETTKSALASRGDLQHRRYPGRTALAGADMRAASWVVDEARVTKLYRDLTRVCPGVELGRNTVPSLMKVQASLSPRTLLLDFFEHEGSLCTFAVSRASSRFVESRWPAAAQEALEACLDLIRPSSTWPGRTRGPRLCSVLRDLFGWAFGPFLPEIAIADHVIVASGGRIAQVPFEALMSSSLEPVIAERSVSRLVTPALIAESRAPKWQRGTAALIRGDDEGAPPLASANAELDAVERCLLAGGMHVQRVSADGSTEQVVDAITSARIVHFAGHACFHATEAMASSLKTPGRALTAVDLLAMDLRTVDLLVLSACDTGRPAPNSLEVQGLLRSVVAAGAAAVVCSNWAADDASSAELMVETYRRWSEGERFSRAFHSATNALRRSEQWNDPRHWANYVLYGVP